MSYTQDELAYYTKNPTHITSELDESLKIELVKFNSTWINYMRPYTMDFAELAYNNDSSVFKYIDREILTIKFLERVVSEFPLFIEYIYSPAIWLITAAIKKDLNVLQVLPKIPTEVYESILEKNGLILEHITVDNQTENLVRIAIKQNINSYQYSNIKNLEFDKYILSVDSTRVDLISAYHPELIAEIVKYNPRFITKFLNTPEIITDEIKKMVILNDPDMFRAFKNPSMDLCKYAISIKLELFECVPFNQELLNYALTINGLALKYVLKKDLRTIKLAIEKNVLALKYIEYPRKFLIDYAFERNGIAIQFISNPTDEQYLSAVTRNGFAIEFIPLNKQTREIQLLALQGAGTQVIKYITPIDDEVVYAILRLLPSYIFEISTPTDIMFSIAFSLSGQLILCYDKWESTFSIELIEDALLQDGIILKYINNKTDRLVLIAIQSFPCAIQWVENQNYEIVHTAVNLDSKALYYVQPDLMDSELTDLVLSIDQDYFTRTNKLTFDEWVAITNQ